MKKSIDSIDIEEVARKERNKYAKAWREANKDKVAATNKRYWERLAKKRLEEEQSIKKEVEEA
jgi:hypothetical protein